MLHIVCYIFIQESLQKRHGETPSAPHAEMRELDINQEDPLLATLQQVFGYEDFRPGQRDIVEKVMKGDDGVVIMHTGGGKTLCFTLPAVLSEGLTVVVTPTISLMQDLKERLHGVCNAITLSSEDSLNAKDTMLANLGSTKILITTPESLQDKNILAGLQKVKVARYIIEEGHCVDEWGHQFRPSYLDLGKVKDLFKVQFVAFTATASNRTCQAIQTLLHLNDAFVIKKSFKRDNLFLHVQCKQSFKQVCSDILELLKTSLEHQCCIIYCLSPTDCYNLCTFLNDHDMICVGYHGGLNPMEKHTNFFKWKSNDVKIIVATKSLGMGIDKGDVRSVIHISFPSSIPEYYQQVGRAGRDGGRSDCFLFYKFTDRGLHLDHIKKIENKTEVRNAHRELKEIIALFSQLSCIKSAILKYFGEDESCGNMCSFCVDAIKIIDMSQEANHAVLLLQGLLVKVKHVPFNLLAKVMKGSKDREVRDKGLTELPLHGSCKQFSISQLEHLLVTMWVKNIIDECDRSIIPGEKAPEVMNQTYKLSVNFHK